MRLSFRKKAHPRVINRRKNKVRIRKKVYGSFEKPRLCVFKSGQHIYAQVVDDVKGCTLASASTLKLNVKNGSNKEAAQLVGAEVAKKALEKNIKTVVFDRGGYVYHGRVKALADGAREAGLKF